MDFLTRISIRSLRSAQKTRVVSPLLQARVDLGRVHYKSRSCTTSMNCWGRPLQQTIRCLDRGFHGGHWSGEGYDSIFFNPGDGGGLPTKNVAVVSYPLPPWRRKQRVEFSPVKRVPGFPPIGSRIVFLTHHGFQGRAVKLQGCTRGFWISFSFLSRSQKNTKETKRLTNLLQLKFVTKSWHWLRPFFCSKIHV